MQSWYDYGVKEGIPRLLDLWDRTGVKVTSHMVGQAVDRSPRLAREIVARGHEAAAHGQTWEPQYPMTPEQELAAYSANIASIERATGMRPVGFNAFWLRGTPNTLSILQQLGFLSHRQRQPRRAVHGGGQGQAVRGGALYLAQQRHRAFRFAGAEQ